MVRKTLRQTDEQVEMSPEKSYELDSWTLCGARHTISAGTTYKPNGLIPFDDYIVVYFKPEDTGGGGHVENALAAVAGYVMDVGKGAYTAFADPKDYSDTTKTGQEIVEQNYEDCIEREGTRWNCKGELVEAGTYTALNYTVGSTVRGLGNVASGRWPWDGGLRWQEFILGNREPSNTSAQRARAASTPLPRSAFRHSRHGQSEDA